MILRVKNKSVFEKLNVIKFFNLNKISFIIIKIWYLEFIF